jgi:hypothetical protein
VDSEAVALPYRTPQPNEGNRDESQGVETPQETLELHDFLQNEKAFLQ